MVGITMTQYIVLDLDKLGNSYAGGGGLLNFQYPEKDWLTINDIDLFRHNERSTRLSVWLVPNSLKE